MIFPLFSGSQSDLIIILGIVLDSYLLHLDDISDFNKAYDEVWGTSRQTRLADAAAMPDEQTLRAISEGKHGDVVKFCKEGRFDWQALKRYTTGSFPEDTWGYKLKAAGSNFYKNAANGNWPQAQQMFTNSLNFIDANEVALSAKMPDTFKASYTAKINLFKQAVKEYGQSKQNIPEGTQARLKVLNQLYKEIIEMMKDAQLKFRNDDSIRKKFVFAEVQSQVSGAGPAGIRGTITEQFDNSLLANVAVTMKNDNNEIIGTATTDAEGKYLINTPSGPYSVHFELEGYISRTIDSFTVDVGTVSRLDVALTPVEPEEE